MATSRRSPVKPIHRFGWWVCPGSSARRQGPYRALHRSLVSIPKKCSLKPATRGKTFRRSASRESSERDLRGTRGTAANRQTIVGLLDNLLPVELGLSVGGTKIPAVLSVLASA